MGEEEKCFDIIPDDMIGLIALHPLLELRDVFRFAATNKRIHGVIGKTFSTFISSNKALTFSQVGQQFARCRIIDALVIQNRLPQSKLSGFFTSLDLRKKPVLTEGATAALIGAVLGVAANWYGADIESLTEAMKDACMSSEKLFLPIILILCISALIKRRSDPNIIQQLAENADFILCTAAFVGMMGACMGGLTYLTSTNFITPSIVGFISASVFLGQPFIKNELAQLISSCFISIIGNICGGFAGLLTGAAYSLVSGNYKMNILSGWCYGATVGGAMAVGIELPYSIGGYAGQQFFKQRIAEKEKRVVQLLAVKEQILPSVKK